MRLDRVLDCKLVEAELAVDGVELLGGRLGELDPDEGTFLLRRFVGIFERQPPLAAAPVLVDGAVPDQGFRLSTARDKRHRDSGGGGRKLCPFPRDSSPPLRGAASRMVEQNQRRGWDSNPRAAFRRPAVFKTAA